MTAGSQACNMKNAELILILTLNFPGFEMNNRECVGVGQEGGCSTSVLHLQRWQSKAIIGDSTTPGTAKNFLTPNEIPDSIININIDNSGDSPGQSSIILMQSQDRINSAFDNGMDKSNTWPTSNGESKFFQAKHRGILGSIVSRFSTPQSKVWLEASGCQDVQVTCAASKDKFATCYGRWCQFHSTLYQLATPLYTSPHRPLR